jgi:protein TonB
MSSEPERADLEVLFDVPTGGHVVLPVKTKNVDPAYPRVARKARIGGVVVLEAVITAEGRVADVRVANSAPLLDDAAVAAIRKWQYESAQLNQLPVAMPVTINVAFSMR